MASKGVYHLLGLGALLCWLPSTIAAQPPAECPVLDQTARARLIDFVQKKYKIPSVVAIDVTETGIIEQTCFHKLDFHSKDAGRPLHLTLTASSDFRFLTRDLMDSTADPAVEQVREKQDLMAKLSRGGAPLLGARNAPVTITVFSDFQCPFCSRAAQGLTKDMLPGSHGAVRLEFRNFPLAMHPWARPAAEAAACAGQQGDRYFWAFHDYFFEHQKELKPDSITKTAMGVAGGLSGFDSRKLTACIDHKAGSAAVQRDVALGTELGVSSTPTMFVNGERITGYRAEQLRAMIERASSSKAQAQGPSTK